MGEAQRAVGTQGKLADPAWVGGVKEGFLKEVPLKLKPEI